MIQIHTPQLRLHVLDTGYCLAWEHHVLQGGARRRIACHSLVALLQHPQHGWLLWDSGYAPRMLDVTQRLPFALYRRATPLYLQPSLAVVAQLATLGLQAVDIRHVIISHFHADHIAGLHDFPDAHFIASHDAYADVAKRRGFNALRRAFIPDLLPLDFLSRTTLISSFAGPVLPALGPTYDIFGDASLQLVRLPGHARGQLGLLAQTERGPVLFAADGCWLRQSLRLRRTPSRITSLFVDDFTGVRDTIEHLSDFAQARPDVVIIPSHCPEAFQEEVAAHG
jgi:glyoxylase-like metal-dependent hydrolase (beta-lactamase superfamily II)